MTNCVGCLYEKHNDHAYCLTCIRKYQIACNKDKYITLEGSYRSQILQKAEEAINGSRQEDYGNPEDNFEKIANLWTIYKDVDFTAGDVAIMMILLKVARISSGDFVDDSLADIAGYAACAGEIAKRESE